MKKLLVLALACFMIVTLFAACGDGGSEVTPPPTDDTTAPVDDTPIVVDEEADLIVWSFTNELITLTVAFKEAYPDLNVQYVMIPMTDGEFQTKVMASITSGDLPDVIALEAAFVREYVEAEGLLADLTDLLPLAQELETYQFMVDAGTDNGVVKAYSWQATPGAVFYRRSMATEIFGSDDPEFIQGKMSDMEGFVAMAEEIKQKTGGSTVMVGSVQEFTNPYYFNREDPWVVDNKLVIDPLIDELLDMAKLFRDNGYEAQAQQWQEGWFAAMNDTLTDANGDSVKVFCYFLPTWGLPYVLMNNAADTAGDWGVVGGPLPYAWGGTWAGVMEGCRHPETAKEFVKFVALNADTLEKWATGVYTNDYLKAIDPTVGDDLKQGPGDFVSSQVVVNKIVNEFDSAATSEFVGGQNSYRGFAAAAPNISLRLQQGTDDAIQRAFNDPLASYAAGQLTKEEAITQFKDAVRNAVPDIIVE